MHLVKESLNVSIVEQDLLHKKQFLKILWSKAWKGGFQLMQILGLLGMYFDGAEVFVTFIQLVSGHTVIRAFTFLWQNFAGFVCIPYFRE